MLNVTYISEIADEITVKVTVVRTGNEYTARVPKYVNMTNEQLLARFRQKLLVAYMKSGIVKRLFEKEIARVNASADRVRAKRAAGEIPDHLGNTA